MQVVSGAERLGDRAGDERWIAHRRERNPRDTALAAGHELRGRLDREARLAAAAGPGQRDEPRAVAEEGDDLLQLACAADEHRRRPWQVRARDRLQRREVGPQPAERELVETLRPGEVLEQVLAEVERFHPAAGQGACLTTQEDLAAVGCSHHAGRTMNVEPDVVAVEQSRLAGVETHADADRAARRPRVLGERTLSGGRSRDGVRRARECDEERIALGVDLVAVVGAERLPEEAAVRLEQLVVTVTRLVQQARGALDVGEQEG